VFYGWWILAAAFFVYSASSIGIYTLPLLNVQLKEAFGWSHAEASLPPSLLYFMLALLAPFGGWLVDALKPRRMFLIGGVLFVLGLAAYPFITSVQGLMAFYAVYAVGITCTGVIPSITLIAEWFRRYRGTAIGLLLVGSSFGGAVFPQITAAAIALGGWKVAALVLAAVACCVGVLPVLIIRNSPVELGLQPDGSTSDTEGETTPTMRLQQAQKSASGVVSDVVSGLISGIASTIRAVGGLMRSVEFFIILSATACVWFCMTGLVQHLSLFMRDIHFDPLASAHVLSILFVCSIVGKASFGWLADRFSKQWILLCASSTMAAGTALMRLAVDAPALWLAPAAVMFGIGFSGNYAMVQLVVAERYGAHPCFGTLLGVVTMIDALAGSTSIYVLGALRSWSGDYRLGFMVSFGIALCTVLCALVLKRYTALSSLSLSSSFQA
jgi:MFS family permease